VDFNDQRDKLTRLLYPNGYMQAATVIEEPREGEEVEKQ
jgi:hypothetical protein